MVKQIPVSRSQFLKWNFVFPAFFNRKLLLALDNRTKILYNDCMTLWQQLQAVVERANTSRIFDVADDDLLRSVRDLSAREGHHPDEMILILLDQAVRSRRLKDRAHRSWDALSLREKQVAALVCTGLTGRQIAAKLVVSPETVKTHVRHILRKFNLSSRRELCRMLSDWDFSPWLSGKWSPLMN